MGGGHELKQTERSSTILFKRLSVLVIYTFSTGSSCTSGPHRLQPRATAASPSRRLRPLLSLYQSHVRAGGWHLWDIHMPRNVEGHIWQSGTRWTLQTHAPQEWHGATSDKKEVRYFGITAEEKKQISLLLFTTLKRIRCVLRVQHRRVTAPHWCGTRPASLTLQDLSLWVARAPDLFRHHHYNHRKVSY